MARGMDQHDHSWGEPAEAAALYAAGALPYEQRAAYEAHLDGCPACLAEVAHLGGVVADLAAVVPPLAPDPRTREALLRRIAAEGPPRTTASPLRRHLGLDTPPGGLPGLVIRRAAEASWETTDVPGVLLRRLYVDHEKNQFTALVRMAPGSSYPAHFHGGPEECLVLEGDLRVGDEVMRAGDYQRAEPGSRHGVQSTDGGCMLLIVSSMTDEMV